ncbi:MAG: glycine cleavage system protein T [Spirochaeta sp. LUC14_002_19_P3]|nr:MAG: glycine cleavage system protein T [Spirochaeta sp. LUC14_002_19_P3]
MKITPLHSVYANLPGTKLVDFGGWEMPIQFEKGILAEHRTVRNAVGLFDVSHMGEILVEGSDALAFLDYLLTNKIVGSEEGRCIYTPMCRDDGGTVDDLLVYVFSGQSCLLVVNAANTDKDFQWIRQVLDAGEWNCKAANVSGNWAQLAVQGPGSLAVMEKISKGFEPGAIPYYRHRRACQTAGVTALVSRTGYTGEDGFEIYCPSADAPRLWDALRAEGALPCGLGARDLLRLEAALPLYGHELTDSISPLEAGLSMFVKLEKEGFIGRDRLLAMKEQGLPRRLYGLEMSESGVPRDGCMVYLSGETSSAGVVTSGGKSLMRESFIALALLENGRVKIGDEVEVDIRGKRKTALIVKKPFYRRSE